MTAIFKREFKSFFTSPVGYVVLALVMGLSGYFFSLYNVTVGYVTLRGVFENLFSFLLLLVLPV